ncbi:PD-(D/E)XK nuclease family protein [Psychrobacter sp. LV10R520-6]|uniref:PDDEXK-like family protein n=1 Tax=Psychrobacter sp. LV10R520-6 TaxID=1415574 RepID=UPI0024C5BD39|nr:PD-(D/E)XK nuclease family protein [Psychrobacter sp. LV10R520-6]SNT69651.1 PD-(D/E)XK nuclease superfamily protein [Psychrobacter sp. LV10R520-6]
MNIIQLKQLIEHIKSLPTPETPELTIFGIGSRGYYENPTSDVLAFFCDSEGDHGLGNLMTEALFDALTVSNPESADFDFSDFSIITEPEREVFTEDNKYIDILLEGNDWVMVIENKVFHKLNNPFKSYQQHIHREEQYQDKHPIFVVLSPKGNAPTGWLGLSYPALLDSVREKLAQAFINQPLNKWLVLLREFILHLEGIMSGSTISPETTDYILENLREIHQAERLKDKTIKAFHSELLQELSNIFPNEKIDIKLSTWNRYPALRFAFKKWQSNSFVALYLDARAGESFCINYYVTDIGHQDLANKANQHLKRYSTKQWKTGKNDTTLGYKAPFEKFDKTIALEGLIHKLTLINEFETEVRSQL